VRRGGVAGQGRCRHRDAVIPRIWSMCRRATRQIIWRT
jgi:hypothetical protein